MRYFFRDAKQKRKTIIGFALLFSFLFIATSSFALEVPKRSAGYITDKAGLLSAQTKSKLEQALAVYERQTTNQVVLVTFPSLEGESIEDFSIRLSEKWKVGQKGRDNGVIFLICKDDQKMRIEVGYGLEGVLPDALAGQITQQIVAPYFKEGRYEEGVLAGLSAIINATQGEFQSTQRSGYGQRRQLTPAEIEALKEQGKAIGTLALIAVFIFFIVDFFRYRRYANDNRSRQSRYSFWEWWFRFAILLFVLNILFRILFYSMLFSRGGYYGGRSGFGGFSGGGGSFGGGGSTASW